MSRKKAIVRLRGGLGNQMFQYAFCEYLRQMDIDVCVDNSEDKCFQCHDGFEVEYIFRIKENKASFWEICSYADYIPIVLRTRFSFNWFLKMTKYETAKVEKYGHKSTHFCELGGCFLSSKDILKLFTTSKTIYFDGYWILPQYVNEIDYIKYFSIKQEYISKYKKYFDQIPSKKNTCSVHIRRGDYVGTKLDICDKNYYDNAMRQINNNVKDVIYFVFSNNIEEAETIIDRAENVEFIDTSNLGTAGVDLIMMSQCKHNIIANSTYSWWGQKLNTYKDKIVIAPEGYLN